MAVFQFGEKYVLYSKVMKGNGKLEGTFQVRSSDKDVFSKNKIIISENNRAK